MKIFGQVVDSGNEPMSLANITIITGALAQKMGTQSDLDGNFTLEDAAISPDSFFKISYIGYKSQIRQAKDLQGKKIVLAEDSEMLEEVVITGGTKPTTTAALSADAKDLLNSNKAKFVQHLKDHKYIYGSIGVVAAVAGIAVIIKSYKI